MDFEQRLASLERINQQNTSLVQAQASAIARLFTENEAQRSSSSHLSSTVARLSAENKALRAKTEEQDRALGDLSRELLPVGYWIMEGAMEEGKEGRWVWSLEKYKNTPSPKIERGRALLPSLPVEILLLVGSSLEKAEKFTLAQVCFRFFDVFSEELYSEAWLDEDVALSFAAAKFSDTSFDLPRLQRLRSMRRVRLLPPFLRRRPNQAIEAQNAQSAGAVQVSRLVLYHDDLKNDVEFYAPLLALLNPSDQFLLLPDHDDLGGLRPTLSAVHSSLFDFTHGWSTLRMIRLAGPGSVPVSQDNWDELAIRVGEKGKPNVFYFQTETLDREVALEPEFSSDLFLRVNLYRTIPRLLRWVFLVCEWEGCEE